MYPRFRPYRCMRGAVPFQTPTNYATIALYNNSNVGEYLAVWIANGLPESGFPGGCGVIDQQLGDAIGVANPLVTQEAAVAGQLTYQDSATLYDLDCLPPYEGTYWPGVPVTATLAVLKPGWSFFFQDQTAADPMGASFLWQTLHRRDLVADDCPICAIIIAGS